MLLLLGPAYFFGTCLTQTPGQDWLLQTSNETQRMVSWKSENRWGVQPSSLGMVVSQLRGGSAKCKRFTTFKDEQAEFDG